MEKEGLEYEGDSSLIETMTKEWEVKKVSPTPGEKDECPRKRAEGEEDWHGEAAGFTMHAKELQCLVKGGRLEVSET